MLRHAAAIASLSVMLLGLSSVTPLHADDADAVPWGELPSRLLEAQRQIRTYSVVLTEEYREAPVAPKEADRMLRSMRFSMQTSSGAATEIGDDERDSMRAWERRRLLEGTKTSCLRSYTGRGREQMRYWLCIDGAGDYLGVTDGTSFSMRVSEQRGAPQHDFLVEVAEAREPSYFGVPPDYGYPYEYWFPRGKITEFKDSEDGLQQILTLRPYDGGGTVVMYIDPLAGYMARRVERRDARGRLLTAYIAEDEQLVNGIWFPMRIAQIEYVDDEGEPKVKSERVMTITDVSLNLTLSHDEFKLILPPGSMVMDERMDPPAMYQTGRTPPEPPMAKENAAGPPMP